VQKQIRDRGHIKEDIGLREHACYQPFVCRDDLVLVKWLLRCNLESGMLHRQSEIIFT